MFIKSLLSTSSKTQLESNINFNLPEISRQKISVAQLFNESNRKLSTDESNSTVNRIKTCFPSNILPSSYNFSFGPWNSVALKLSEPSYENAIHHTIKIVQAGYLNHVNSYGLSGSQEFKDIDYFHKSQCLSPLTKTRSRRSSKIPILMTRYFKYFNFISYLFVSFFMPTLCKFSSL